MGKSKKNVKNVPKDDKENIGINVTTKSLWKLIEKILKKRQYGRITYLFTKAREAEQNISILAEISMDIYHKICLEYLSEKNHQENLTLYNCAEELLMIVATYAPGEKIISSLQDITQNTKSENILMSTLKALLARYNYEKSTTQLTWILHCLTIRLNSLPMPDFLSQGYDNAQKCLLEQNDQIKALLRHYAIVIDFYKPLLESACKYPLYVKQGFGVFRNREENVRKVMTLFLLSLLGKPFNLLNLSKSEGGKFGGTNTCTLNCAASITRAITQSVGDPYFFLIEMEEKLRFNFNPCGRTIYPIFSICFRRELIYMAQEEVKRNALVPYEAHGTYYYMLLVEGISKEKIYLVYNPLFILEACLYLAFQMLCNSEPNLYEKAIKLIEHVLKQLGNEDIPATFVEVDIYNAFVLRLWNAAVDSPLVHLRKMGFRLLYNLIMHFDDKSQALLTKFCRFHKDMIEWFDDINSFGDDI
uniref:Uncharacterized protein n=1 Tax=Glossina brevipalpis TaxID=37001 RepID=A0A1A9WI58_9MUSC